MGTWGALGAPCRSGRAQGVCLEESGGRFLGSIDFQAFCIREQPALSLCLLAGGQVDPPGIPTGCRITSESEVHTYSPHRLGEKREPRERCGEAATCTAALPLGPCSAEPCARCRCTCSAAGWLRRRRPLQPLCHTSTWTSSLQLHPRWACFLRSLVG